MHSEVGDDGARAGVVGLVLGEQCRAEFRARQLDDIEAGFFQRNADDLEGARAERFGHRDRRARVLGAEYRIRRAVTLGDPALLLVVVFAVDLVATLDAPQPIEHREIVGGVDAGDLSGDRNLGVLSDRGEHGAFGETSVERRLDIADGHRQQGLLTTGQLGLEDAEGGGKLDQRRIFVGTHRERKAARVLQRPAGIVLEFRRNLQLERLLFGQTGAEGDVIDRVAVFRRSQPGGIGLARAVDDSHLRRVGPRDGRGERQRQGLDRNALRILVDAGTGERGAEQRAHAERQRLVRAVATPVVAAMPLPQTSLTSRVGRQRARARERHQRRIGRVTQAQELLVVASGRRQPEREAAGASLVGIEQHAAAGNFRRTICGCPGWSCARRRRPCARRSAR